MLIWSFIISWIFSIIGYLFGSFIIFILLSFISFIIFCFILIKFSGFNSITFLFLFLFGLYGYSVPLSILFKADIGSYRLSDILDWFDVTKSLYSFILINHLALLGMSFAYLINHNKLASESNCAVSENNNNEELKNLSIICGIISSIFELINFIRVGGFPTLDQGKLVYESAVSDLSLTLPSDFFCSLSFIFLAISIHKIKLLDFIFTLCSNAIYLSIYLYIGERGTIFTIILLLLIGLTFYNKIIKIRPFYVLGLSVLYLFFLLFTVYRNIFSLGLNENITFKMTKDYICENKNVVLFVLNPANSEFGTACLNYRVNYEQNSDHSLKFGKTYLHFYTQLLPQSINPFYDKAVITEYRDKFFPERSLNGSIGGTAYSSLMEAYINFGLLGGFLIYFIIFFFLIRMEIYRWKNNGLFIHVFYMILITSVLLFHRSTFEYVIYNLILFSTFAYLIIAIYKKLKPTHS